MGFVRRPNQDNELQDKVREYYRLAKYIRHSDGPHTWRPRPENPIIYYSFSLNQFEKSHYALNNAFLGNALKTKLITQVSENSVGAFRAAIESQWVSRARLPIQELERDATTAFIQNNNVVFILANSERFSNHLRSVKGGEVWSTINPDMAIYPVTAQTKARYKVIFTPYFSAEAHLTKADIYSFLHEIGHGIGEFKHFKFYDDHDREPYNPAMTCKESVMSYPDTCPPLLQKANELFEPYGSFNYADSNLDPELKKLVEQYFNSFSDKLGPVDIAAASLFKTDWEKRNKAAISPSVETQPLNLKDARWHEELIVMPITLGGNNSLSAIPQMLAGYYDSLLDWLGDGMKAVVKECPTYFSQYGENNSITFFKGVPQISFNASPMLPSPPSLLNLALP